MSDEKKTDVVAETQVEAAETPVEAAETQVEATATPVETPVAPEASDRYTSLMTLFAATCGKPLDQITAALSEDWINGPEDAAIDTLANEDNAPIADLVETLVGIGVKKGPARTAVNALREAVAATTAAPVMSGDSAIPGASESGPGLGRMESLLEPLPTDDVLLQCTQAGGVLTVPAARVVMAGRCLMANTTGMLGLDREIVSRIDHHYTEAITEEVPDWFWELSNQVTRKQYAPVFNALGMPGASRFATRTARESFWREMRADFLPKLEEVQDQLAAWQTAWLTKAQAMMGLQMNAAMSRMSGSPPMAIPASGIPPTNMVVASVEALIDTTQRLFAGTKRAVAIAIETDAKAMRELLRRNDLHMHMGYASRLIMLKELKVASSSDIIQLESLFATYLMNVLKVPQMPPTQSTAYFLQELCEVGTQLAPVFALCKKGIRTQEDDLPEIEEDEGEERVYRAGSQSHTRRPGPRDKSQY